MRIELLDNSRDGILHKVLQIERIDVSVAQQVEEIDQLGGSLTAGETTTVPIVEVGIVGLIDMYLVGHARLTKLDAYAENCGHSEADEKGEPVFFHWVTKE
jgi:hypothetical protein